jgi:hypothetical protein
MAKQKSLEKDLLATNPAPPVVERRGSALNSLKLILHFCQVPDDDAHVQSCRTHIPAVEEDARRRSLPEA